LERIAILMEQVAMGRKKPLGRLLLKPEEHNSNGLLLCLHKEMFTIPIGALSAKPKQKMWKESQP